MIGLIPVAGDLFSAGLSGFLIVQAARAGAPRELLLRRGGNVLLDLLAGAIPVVGDLADIAVRANTRNLKLVERWLDEPVEVQRQQRRTVWILSAVIALAVLGLFVLAGLVATALNRLILG